ncbi:MAG: tetratricopeptide repeat protein [Pseudomonadota bacterium]
MARKTLEHSLLALTMMLGAATATAEGARQMDGDALWRNESNYKQAVRAWDELDAGDLDHAIERFSRVVKRAQGSYERSQALLGLAQAQLMRRNVDAAIRHYEEVIDLNHVPDRPHFEVMLKLAELHVELDNLTEAGEWLRRWSTENPARSEAEQFRADRLEAKLFGRRI